MELLKETKYFQKLKSVQTLELEVRRGLTSIRTLKAESLPTGQPAVLTTVI